MAGAHLNLAENLSFQQYRQDFPVLSRTMNGKRLAYLDSAASAQKPRAVIDAMTSVMEHGYANIHRGVYEMSQTTTKQFETVRGKIAQFIGAKDENEIIFIRNTTEAVNLVAQSWARTYLREGDEIILSTMEHHANLVPWHILAAQIGVQIRYIPMQDDGTLDLDSYQKLLTPRTRLVSVVHISNALGTVNDVARITEIAKDFHRDIVVMVDASQSVVHRPVDVGALGCDFLAFTGHKLYGPTGIGVLWGRAALLQSMPPYQGGGDMIEEVTLEGSTFKPPPARFEAGTPAIIEVIGLGAAIAYLNAIGMARIAEHESFLLAYAREKIAQVDALRFYGTGPDRACVLSFTAMWGHTSDIGMILDQCGVAVRTGHHCCQPVMRRLGIDSTVRASIGLYTNTDDIDQMVDALLKAKDMLS